MDLDIRTGPEWERFAKDLKQAARDVEREMRSGLKKAGDRTSSQVRSSALSTLPRAGGLAAEVARAHVSVRAIAMGRTVRLAIKADHRYQIAAMNRGTVVHPVYGNRAKWVSQKVRPDWFDKPIKRAEPVFKGEVQQAINRIVSRLER